MMWIPVTCHRYIGEKNRWNRYPLAELDHAVGWIVPRWHCARVFQRWRCWGEVNVLVVLFFYGSSTTKSSWQCNDVWCLAGGIVCLPTQ